MNTNHQHQYVRVDHSLMYTSMTTERSVFLSYLSIYEYFLCVAYLNFLGFRSSICKGRPLPHVQVWQQRDQSFYRIYRYHKKIDLSVVIKAGSILNLCHKINSKWKNCYEYALDCLWNFLAFCVIMNNGGYSHGLVLNEQQKQPCTILRIWIYFLINIHYRVHVNF